MRNYRQIIDDNKTYSESFGKHSDLKVPPERKIAILTCMDARLDPLRFTGLKLGDAHIIRNAGGRASDDAIRSLIISYKLLGTNEFYVIHHSDCGMESLTNNKMNELLNVSFESVQTDNIDWLTIDDQKQSVRDDVNKIKNHPLISKDISVYGFIFDVKTGQLNEVK